MLHKEFNNELRAYPTHQAVQTIGSTAESPKTFIVMGYGLVYDS